MLCKVDGCQDPAVTCAECGSYVCRHHGRPRSAEEHGMPIPGTSEAHEEWLCQGCAEKLAQRTWSRLSN